MGGISSNTNTLSYEEDSFQGNKGIVKVVEVNFVDEKTQEPNQMKLKIRMFFDKKTKRFYQIFNTLDTETEQILSTLNFSKIG